MLKSVYVMAGVAAGASLFLLAMLALIGLISPKLMLGSVVMAAISFLLLLMVSKRIRRDYTAVAIAAWRLEREERHVLS